MRKRLLSFLITGGLLTLAVGAPVWPQTFPAPGPNVPHAHVSGGPALDENASTLCSSLCPGTPESVSVSFTSTAGTHIINPLFGLSPGADNGRVIEFFGRVQF